MLKRMCPKCGREDDGEFINAFCKPCFLSTHSLYSIPELSVEECVKCGRVREGNEWRNDNKETVAKLLKTKVKSSHDVNEVRASSVEEHNKHYTADLDISLSVEGNQVSAEEKIRVEKVKTQCPDCALKAGGYHEAVIQLRGDRRRVEKYARELVRLISEKTFVTREVEKDGGLDLLIGHKRPALEAVSKLHLERELTNKLVGEKDGRKLHRATICIRL